MDKWNILTTVAGCVHEKINNYSLVAIVLDMVTSPHASEPRVQQTFVELELAAISICRVYYVRERECT